ncbi:MULTISPECIES: YmfL family putative regulatory protein [Pseudomonas]|uniref:YmfL family putative regulatory protein n=1 Tax=Pseudomonas TaxID=286 RepID=UPI001AD65D4F|nr:MULTISPECIES: YmfL family putative regulatory protein [Pseudomonas]
MKKSVLETRRQVASAVICDYPGGRECAAARLGMPLKKFDNHLYENAGSRPLTDDQIVQLEKDAGTTHLPDYIAAQYGGVFVKLDEAGNLDNIDLYTFAVNTSTKRGLVDQIIAKALEDGVVDESEIAQILAAHRQHMSARCTEVYSVIALHSKPSGSRH